MKKIFNLITLSSLTIFLNSCAPSEKEWHYSAAKIGAQSIYIQKDGAKSESRRVGDKFLIHYFDANGKEIKNSEEEIKLEFDPYKNPNALRGQTFISDQRK